MPLVRPNDEDLRKLHAEVNQIVNQRFLLSTLAVTIFGVIAAWTLKDPIQTGGEIGWFRYLVTLVLLVVLFGLFYLMHRLRAMLRIISAYLVETKASKWELDWKKYREQPYASYTKAQTWLFMALGILGTTLPFALAFAYQLSFDPIPAAYASISLGLIYLIFLIGMGFGTWFDSENHAQQRWRKLNAPEKHRPKKK